MNKPYDIEKIELYLQNKLSEAEAQEIEQRMKTDAGFAEEVVLHRDAMLGIDMAGNLEFQQVMAGVGEELRAEGFFEHFPGTEGSRKKKSPSRLAFYRWTAIAASVLIVATVLGWIFLRPPDPQKLASQYYQPFEDLISEDVDYVLDSEGMIDSHVEKDWLLDLKEGLQAYTGKNYPQAIEKLQSYRSNTSPRDIFYPEATFYLALSYYESGNPGEAQILLQELSGINGFELQKDVQWYLALSYLALNRPDKAILLLKALPDDPSANHILNKLI